MDKPLSAPPTPPKSVNAAGWMIFRRVGCREMGDGEASKALQLDERVHVYS